MCIRDSYWTGQVDGMKGEMTRLIESTMKIIAVDRNKRAADSDGAIQSRTMTVAATPEQVARLAQAQATGRLVMSLVGTGDQIASGAIEIDSKALLGIEAQQPVQVQEAPKIFTIRTRNGVAAMEILIPCTN